jgi:hypothetical protein
MTTPEQAMAALAAWFTSQIASTFVTQNRRLQNWTQVANQPALFLRHLSETDSYDGQGLPKTILDAECWVYAQTAGPDAAPDTELNALKATIAGALAPDNEDTASFTLGGLVSWCRIEGKAEFYPAEGESKQSVMVVPIKMLITQ